MTTKLRSLIFESRPNEAERLARALASAGLDAVCRYAGTADELAAEIVSFEPAWILVGEDQKPEEALEALARAGRHEDALPILAVRDPTDPDACLSCLQAGAWDVVSAEAGWMLRVAVERGLERASLLASQRQTEERLRMFEQVVEESPAVVIVTDPEERIEYVNPAFTRVTGYLPTESRGQTPGLLESGEVDGARLLDLAETLRRGEAWRGEVVNRRKDGSLYTEDLVAFPMVDTSGAVRHFVSIALDVSERRRAVDSLQESEERYRRLVEGSPYCVHEIDLEGRWISINPAGLAILELADDRKLLGSLYLDTVCAEDREQVSSLLDAARRGETSFFEFGAERGRRFRSSFVPLRDARGRIERLMGITIDVTEQTSAEARLRQLSTAVEQGPAGVLITSTEGAIEYVNRAFTKMTGYAADEVLGRNPRLLKSQRTPPALYETLWRTITAGDQWRGEIQNRRRDGSIYWERMSISPIIAADGGISHFVAIKEDITARKKAEDRITRQAELLDRIFEHSLDCVVLLDRHYNFVRVSRSYARVCGRPESDFVGRNHFDLYPSILEAEFNEALLGNEIYTRLARPFTFPDHPDWGTTYWDLSLVPVHDVHGDVELLLFTLRDVTERCRAEEEARRHTEDLERFNRLAVGRELRMIELKREVNGLAAASGRTAPYELESLAADPPFAGTVSSDGEPEPTPGFAAGAAEDDEP